jgi:hypothetical protein
MEIYIDSIKKNNNKIEVILSKNGKIIDKSEKDASYKQAEILLRTIDSLLKKNKLNLLDITGINVRNNGGSFTSLRIGVVTANTLGYALGIPVKGWSGNEIKRLSGTKKLKSGEYSILMPKYFAKPNITISKKIF